MGLVDEIIGIAGSNERGHREPMADAEQLGPVVQESFAAFPSAEGAVLQPSPDDDTDETGKCRQYGAPVVCIEFRMAPRQWAAPTNRPCIYLGG